jgi:Flp pilus assembly protein TadG
VSARRAGRGSVTAETAVALPAIVLVAVVLVCVGQVAMADLRCVDAARAGVRLAARGESGPSVVARASSIAPTGAAVSAGASGEEAVVEVRASVGLPLGWRVEVGSRAVADVERSSVLP